MAVSPKFALGLASTAEAETNVARAELAAAELEVIEQIKRAYYEMYFLQKALQITKQSRELLGQIARVADFQYRANMVSQQDLLRAQVEELQVDNELIRLRQQLQSAQASLAALLHVSPETRLEALGELPARQPPQDLERLYQQALAARPELHAQLAAIERDRHKADLARLQYFPDLDVGVMVGGMTTSQAIAPTADGIGMVNLGANVDVPIYRKKLVAGVRSAEAEAVASARQYDALKDTTQYNVKDLFVQARSQQELLQLFANDIIPRAQQTLTVSMQSYEANKVDILQLLDNWRVVLRFQIMYHQLEAQLRQTLSTLERTVGGQLDAETPQPQAALSGQTATTAAAHSKPYPVMPASGSLPVAQPQVSGP